MPRQSERIKVIESLKTIVDKRKKAERENAFLFDDLVDSDEEFFTTRLERDLERIESRRYLFRPSTYRPMKKATWSWEDIISEDSTTFTDKEFLYLFRMTRESFKKLHDIIKNAEQFQPTPR